MRRMQTKIKSLFAQIPSYFEYHKDLAKEETSLLFFNSYGGIFAAILNSLIFYFISASILERNFRNFYIIMNFIAGIVQIFLILFYDRKIRQNKNLVLFTIMKNIFTFWVFFYGFLISLPLFVMSQGPMSSHHIYLVLVALGMTAGSSATMGSAPQSHFFFSVGITSPVLWYFFTSNQKPMFGLGAMVIIYLGVMLYITLLLKKNALNTILYRFQNKDLLARLENQTQEEFLAQEKFKKIFLHSPIAISITTLKNGIFLDVNKAFLKLSGFSREEVIGKSSQELNLFPSSHEWTLIKNRVTEKGYIREHEIAFHHRNGSKITGLFFIEKIILNEKEALLNMVLDISHQKEKELELEKTRSEAVDAAKAKTNFLATMSHEIRTPMNAILGMTDLAYEANDVHIIKDYLLTVKDSAKHLTTIINDILDFSKIESGNLELEETEIDIRSMLQSISYIFQEAIYQKGLDFRIQIDDTIPKIIMGDETRIRQILINLISNANKFTLKGSIEIIVQKENNKIAIYVKDTGIGIPQEMQQSIFHRFRQAETSISRRFGGTGLGLAISKHLINLMNGEIIVNSEPDRGSTFIIKLPIRSSFHTERKKSGKQDKSDSNDIFSHSMNILLVEDNEDNIKLASIVLKNRSHRIYIARNGNEALEILEDPKNKIELVLMDIEMPIMDGIETTRQIRLKNSKEIISNVPIIAMTAHAVPEIQEKAIESGMDGYIVKPINIHELENEINRIITARNKKNQPRNKLNNLKQRTKK